MISSVTSSDTTTAAEQMKKETGLDKDDFLKLFITQLQYQDPLNPMDGTEFIGQLAQLTQVEQAYNTNSNLESILSALNGNAGYSAVSLIGKEVLAPGSQITLADGSDAVLNYRLAQSSTSTEIKIKDESGDTVRTLTREGAAAGDYSVAWDGKDDNGNTLPAGTYTFAVNGTDTSGNSFSAASLIRGTVTGVKVDGSSPVLTVGGVDISISDILAVEGVS